MDVVSGRSGSGRHRQDGAALRAGAELCARVELLNDLAQLHLDVRARERRLVELASAALAEPCEPVELVRPALALDDEPPRVGRPDRAVRRASAAEHHLTLAHPDVALRAVSVDAPNGDVALQLTEDLVARVDVEVVPRVRAADDLVDELAFGKDFLVGDGPAEVTPVLLDPAHQVQRHDIRHHRLLPRHATTGLETRALSAGPRRPTRSCGRPL